MSLYWINLKRKPRTNLWVKSYICPLDYKYIHTCHSATGSSFLYRFSRMSVASPDRGCGSVVAPAHDQGPRCWETRGAAGASPPRRYGGHAPPLPADTTGSVRRCSAASGGLSPQTSYESASAGMAPTGGRETRGPRWARSRSRERLAARAHAVGAGSPKTFPFAASAEAPRRAHAYAHRRSSY